MGVEIHAFIGREFLQLVEAASDLDDRLSGRYFMCCNSSRKKDKRPSCLNPSSPQGDALQAEKSDLWQKFLYDQKIANRLGPVRLRNPARLPRWARDLGEMLKAIAHAETERKDVSLLFQICEPALEYARARLRSALPAEILDQLPRAALCRLEKQLRRLLSQTAKPSVELNFKAFETAFRYLNPSKSAAQYRSHIEAAYMGEHPSARLLELLQIFPSLARLWSELIVNWAGKVSEFAGRLNADKRSISRKFFEGRNLGRLVDIEINLSDPHHGGREVIIVKFEIGNVVYKPRSGHGEREWFGFLHWINNHGFRPQFRVVRLLNRREYFWMEFVAPAACNGEIGARRYYRRAGGVVCAAHLIGAFDCHRGNLIACADQPILIDAETLFYDESKFSLRSPLTIFRTGFLPIPKTYPGARYKFSPFGLNGVGSHTAVLDGKALSAARYSNDFLNGFKEVWNIALGPKRRRAALLCRIRASSPKHWRRLYWPTTHYARIRDASLQASALRSGMSRFEFIGTRCQRKTAPPWIIRQEIKSLLRLDLPHFTQTPARVASLPKATAREEALRDVRLSLGSLRPSPQRAFSPGRYVM